MIAENNEKFISFNINVTIDKHKTPLGRKQVMKWLQFFDSVRFIVRSLPNSLEILLR